MIDETCVLGFRSVEDGDLPLLEVWLRKERILKWFHDTEDWLSEVRQRDGAFGWIRYFIVTAGARPVGFCLWYDCFDAQEDWYSVARLGEMFSLDYLIGEDDFLGKGHGKAIVAAMVERIRRHCQTAEIVVQPELENKLSCGVLLANGFVFDGEKKYFILPERVSAV
jgi:RimJ/RimL family protein N-acetyltransferase